MQDDLEAQLTALIKQHQYAICHDTTPFRPQNLIALHKQIVALMEAKEATCNV